MTKPTKTLIQAWYSAREKTSAPLDQLRAFSVATGMPKLKALNFLNDAGLQSDYLRVKFSALRLIQYKYSVDN